MHPSKERDFFSLFFKRKQKTIMDNKITKLYQITVYDKDNQYIVIAGKPDVSYEDANFDDSIIRIDTGEDRLIYALKCIQDYLIGMDQFAERLSIAKFEQQPQLTDSQKFLFKLLGYGKEKYGICDRYGLEI